MIASDTIKFHEPSEYKASGSAGDPNPNPVPPPGTGQQAEAERERIREKHTARNMAHRFGGSGKGGKLDIQHEKE